MKISQDFILVILKMIEAASLPLKKEVILMKEFPNDGSNNLNTQEIEYHIDYLIDEGYITIVSHDEQSFKLRSRGHDYLDDYRNMPK